MKTRPTRVRIEERRKPHPAGQPGCLRVDTVHQGDLDGRKGLYEIDLVDFGQQEVAQQVVGVGGQAEVTQYEFVAATKGMSERFPITALQGAIEALPFNVKGLHVDNGSGFVNHKVAALLNRLHVEEFTKSRPRRCNDNALVESRNASVVRRYVGHDHIPRHHAALVDRFLRDVLAPFLEWVQALPSQWYMATICRCERNPDSQKTQAGQALSSRQDHRKPRELRTSRDQQPAAAVTSAAPRAAR